MWTMFEAADMKLRIYFKVLHHMKSGCKCVKKFKLIKGTHIYWLCMEA